MRHVLEVDDLTPGELGRVLDLAADPAPPQVLAGQGMALLFEKPSARTRNSMEMAVVQLGGHPMYIQGAEVGFDARESVEDVTRTLACYHGAVGARVFAHATVERMAALDLVPIVNLLSDAAPPLQALAVEGADIVYTDVGTSMGQEDESAQRLVDFEGYRVDERLLDAAGTQVHFLHCLPAHRGEEVTSSVVDGPASRVWQQAENRMHAARGLLAWLLGEAVSDAGEGSNA